MEGGRSHDEGGWEGAESAKDRAVARLAQIRTQRCEAGTKSHAPTNLVASRTLLSCCACSLLPTHIMHSHNHNHNRPPPL